MSAIRKEDRVYFLIFVFIGLAVLVLGIILLYGSYNGEGSCTEEVKASVISTDGRRTKNDVGSKSVYMPVFEYEYKGETYVQGAPDKQRKGKFEKGDEVTVNIDPDSPQTLYIKPDFTDRLLYIILMVFGGIAAVVGSELFFASRAKNGSAKE